MHLVLVESLILTITHHTQITNIEMGKEAKGRRKRKERKGREMKYPKQT